MKNPKDIRNRLGSRLLRLALVGTALCFSSSALAIPLLETFNISEPSRPFGGRSASTSSVTAYYNPARLTQTTESFTFTYLAINQNLSINLGDRPKGYDVAADVYRARVLVDGQAKGLAFRPYPTRQIPEPRSGTSINEVDQYTMIGFASKYFEDRLAVGMTAILPVGVFQEQSPFYVDERTQFFSNRLNFELLGDRFKVTTFALALAYQVHERLSVGFGGTLANNLISIPQIYLKDAGDQEEAETNPQTRVEAIMSPYMGIVYHQDHLEISSSVHFPSKTTLEGKGELRFWDFEYPDGQTYLKQDFSLTFLDQPLRINVAPNINFNLSGTLLEIYSDLAWTRWSTYTSRHNQQPNDWVDTLSTRVGSSIRIGSHQLGVGIMYEPTPVPNQTGRTNYVDNARVGGQLGWSWRPLSSLTGLEIGLGLQVQRLLERKHVKAQYDPSDKSGNGLLDEVPDEAIDVVNNLSLESAKGLQTNNLGFPYFQHGGWLNSLVFTVGFSPDHK